MTQQLDDRILAPREVMKKTSLSRSTLWRMAAKGMFPHSIRLSPNRIGWSEKEVLAWMAARKAA